MANVVTATFAGLDSVWVTFIDSLGRMNGFSNLSTTGNSGMRKIKAAQTLPIALPAPNRKVIRGDNIPYDQFQFSGDTLPGGNLEVGVMDLTLDAAAQGSSVWALGNWSLGIFGILNPTFASMSLLGHQDAHSQDSGSAGQGGYINYLFVNCQLLPLGSNNPAYQAEGQNIYGATFSPFVTFPTGADLDSSNFTVEQGTMVKWFSKYRTFFHAVIGDGSATSFTVDHTPVDTTSTKIYSSDLTGSTPASVTPSTVTPSTKTITVGSALLATKIYVVMYEASKI